jgi:predicted nucleic acid-binding protein
MGGEVPCRGESQVIAHCVGGSRWAVLDDLAARRCAVAHHVSVIGTLGVVLRSKTNHQTENAWLVRVELLAGVIEAWKEMSQGSFFGKVVRSLRTKALLGVLG